VIYSLGTAGVLNIGFFSILKLKHKEFFISETYFINHLLSFKAHIDPTIIYRHSVFNGYNDRG
jgi:hypothetical protein